MELPGENLWGTGLERAAQRGISRTKHDAAAEFNQIRSFASHALEQVEPAATDSIKRVEALVARAQRDIWLPSPELRKPSGKESGNWRRLNATQKSALLDAEVHAISLSAKAHAKLVKRVKGLGFSEADLSDAIEYLGTRAPVTINFHPNKATEQPGVTVLDALLEGNVYKNQFETRITSGAKTAVPGGSRDNWEKRIFRGDYHTHDLVALERPKYGALNAENHPRGGTTNEQYGKSFIVLQTGIKGRTTFTPTDSSISPATQIGVATDLEHLLAEQSVPDAKLKAIIEEALGRPVEFGKAAYIEAQIHGPVDFRKDLAALVAHVEFKGDAIYEPKLREFAEKFQVPIFWTNGNGVYDDSALMSYQIPHPNTKAGMVTVWAPHAPEGYTAVKYGDSLAFVPTKGHDHRPATPPSGYVAYQHPSAGIIYLPRTLVIGGAPARPFGGKISGLPDPIKPLGATYTFPGGAPAIGGGRADGPPAPQDYYPVKFSGSVAFVPLRNGLENAAPPPGYVRVMHAKAGAMFLPEQLAPKGDPLALVTQSFGEVAVPEGYTSVKYGNRAAFVPAVTGASKPAAPPPNYAAYEHPAAGTIYLPTELAPEGIPKLPFGATFAGMPEPIVPVGTSYSFAQTADSRSGLLAVDGPPLPEGYTAVKMHDSVAFVPQRAGAARPLSTPSGYVACEHPEAGIIFVPEKLAAGGAPSVPFGGAADGMPEPIVPVGATYSLPHPAGTRLGRLTFDGPAPPKGYTAVRYGDSLAFVPAKVDAITPAAPPPGYVAFEHPEAGTVYLPEALAPFGRPSQPFGGRLKGMPDPVVPLGASYSIPHPDGSEFGFLKIDAPAAPKGYTAVKIGDSVAFVRQGAEVTAPAAPPSGYAAFEHPEAGTVYFPESLASGGVPSVPFGGTVKGFSDPAVPVGASYLIPHPAGSKFGLLTIDAPVPPKGYTAVKYGDSVAFVRAAGADTIPLAPPSGYIAWDHPAAGTVYLPRRLAPEGTPSLPFGSTAKGMPAPITMVGATYWLPHPDGLTFGTIFVDAPPAPAGYTAVKYGDSVAFVPATADVVKPAAPPPAFVAYEHASAGTVYLPERLAPGGTPSLPFGGALLTNPAPATLVGATYHLPHPSGSAFGNLAVDAPVRPKGYSVCKYGASVAFVPESEGIPKLASPPVGYVAHEHPTAGTIYLPERLAPLGPALLPIGDLIVGKTPPPGLVGKSYAFPHPSGPAVGTLTFDAPVCPKGYTAVRFGDAVAFVPAVKEPTESVVPPGYVAVEHATAGTVYLPEEHAPAGLPIPGTNFGPTAEGLPAPISPVEEGSPRFMPAYSFPADPGFAGIIVEGPSAPAGFSVLRFGDSVAFVPAAHGTPLPTEAPEGFVAVPHPLAGTVYLPAKYLSKGFGGGIPMPGVYFGPTASGMPPPLAQLFR